MDWRKSSYSDSNGGDCVEVALDTDWRKSSFSDSNGGSCVEAASGSDVILVRDTTNRDGVTLTIPTAAWQTFVTELR